LLYPDVHGIKSSEDIGILSGFKVLDNGDWYVEFRLYDESDGVDQASIDKGKKLWSQINGIEPYTTPKKMGFSIEGYIPGNQGLLIREQQGVIDDVVIEGVVLVPRPAYKDSVVHAVYKALGEVPPWEYRNRFRSGLREALKDKEAKDEYYARRYEIDATKDGLIDDLMAEGFPDIEDKLKMIFQEYSDLMIELILNSSSVFTAVEKDMASPYENTPGAQEVEILQKLQGQLEELVRGLTGEVNEQDN
jgi:hypothetical protein